MRERENLGRIGEDDRTFANRVEDRIDVNKPGKGQPHRVSARTAVQCDDTDPSLLSFDVEGHAYSFGHQHSYFSKHGDRTHRPQIG